MRDYFKEGGVMRSSVPIEQFPLPHRGMIWLGLGMIVLWMAFEISIPVSNPLANPIAYPLAQDVELLSGALLLFGIVFSVFGFGCELVLGVFGWQRSFAHERRRLEELSGCSASNRRRVKVHKRVCVTPDELEQIKTLLEELRSR